MKKIYFIKNTILMAIIAIVTRCMSLWLRSFLIEKINAEGIGIYQLILTVYVFFAAIAVSGSSLVVTRLVSEQYAKKNLELALKSLKQCILFSEISAFILCFLQIIFSRFISIKILGNERCAGTLCILALSLPFMTFSACLRGYFTALRKVVPTIIEQILEQITEIIVCVLIISNLSVSTVEEACMAVSFGTLSAEFLSFIYSFLLYIFNIKNIQKVSPNNISKFEERVQMKKIFSISIPVTVNSALRSGLSAIENIFIPIGLLKYGADNDSALAHYGILTGLAMPVITFPMVFVIPAATLVVPELSEAFALNNRKSVHRITIKMIKYTLIYSIPISLLFVLFSTQIGETLFNNNIVGKYIAVLSPVIPLMCLDSVVDGILKGTNRQINYLLINIIDSVIRIILTWFIIPIFGPIGSAGIIVFSELFNVTLSVMECFKK